MNDHPTMIMQMEDNDTAPNVHLWTLRPDDSQLEDRFQIGSCVSLLQQKQQSLVAPSKDEQIYCGRSFHGPRPALPDALCQPKDFADRLSTLQSP